MNIDELFNIPAVASGRNKRKMADTPDLQFVEAFKASREAKEREEAEASSSKRRNVTFADEAEELTFEENDEEGRFFGGGLTDKQSELLDIIDQFDDDLHELNQTDVKKMIGKLEKTMNKNQEQRARYADQPEKFMESETDLDEEIKNLFALTQAPQLYPELVSLGSIPTLVSLLSHENTDIAIDAIDLFNELTDDDVGIDEEGLRRSDEATEGIRILADALVDNKLAELLLDNLIRFDEEEETDRQGVFKTLGIFENLLSINPHLAEPLVEGTQLLPWLLKRVQKKSFDSNRGYATELLSILLQVSRDVRLKMCDLDGIDTLLRCLAPYKRRDPEDEDEVEAEENLFNALCSLLNEPEAKQQFFTSEGVDLMLIMLREKTNARIRAIKVLDYALSSPAGRDNCLRLVDASGLKSIFPLFMSKGNRKLKKSHKSFSEAEDQEHILCIFLSLMRNLSRDEVQRVRFVRKFIDDEYEKVNRLLELKKAYQDKDRRVRLEIDKEKEQLDDEEAKAVEEEFEFRRLDAGLFILQRLCLVLASLCVEDDSIKQHTLTRLQQEGQDMSSITAYLEEEAALMADFNHLVKIIAGEPNAALTGTQDKTTNIPMSSDS